MKKYFVAFLSLVLLVACAKNGSDGRNGTDGNTGRISVFDSGDNFIGYQLISASGLSCVTVDTAGFYCFSTNNGKFYGTLDKEFNLTTSNGCYYTDGSCSSTCYASSTGGLQRKQIIAGNAYSYFKYVGNETEVTSLAVQTCWNGTTCGNCATTLTNAIPLTSSVTLDSKYHTIAVPVYLDWD